MGIKDDIKEEIKKECSEKDWKEMKECFGCCKGCKNRNDNHGGNAVYCLGVIGAAVYFVGQATSFWAGVVGLLKALVWPTFLVFEAFKVLTK
jgi:hypothetical protein